MHEKDVVTAMSLNCEGVITDTKTAAPLEDKPAQITVSVYRDGAREVGCPYLNRQYGTCRALKLDESWHPNYKISKCIHLLPVDSKNVTVPKPRGWV